MSSDSEDEDIQFLRDTTSNRRRSPKLLYFLTILSTISGFLFGYDTGVVSGAMLLVRKDFSLTNFWHELIVSATVGSAFVFSLLTGSLSDRVGRKPTILAASVAFTLGAFLMALAPNKELLLSGRLVVGAGVGLGSATVPVYISECCEADLRGVLVTANNAAITAGQLVAGLVAGLMAEVEDGWRYMLGIAAAPALVQLVGFTVMPESPRYLIKRERYDKAQQVLSSIRHAYHPVRDELEDMKVSCRRTPSSPGFFSSLRAMLTSTPARRSLLLGCLLQFVQQIAGINTVMYYAASILSMAGASSSLAIWLSALTAAVNFVFTLVGIYLVSRWTRRFLLFSSLCGAIVSLVLISASFAVIDSSTTSNSSSLFSSSSPSSTQSSSWSSSSSTGPILAFVSMCLYLAMFAPGLGPLPWTINSEIHPPWCRSQAAGLATATNWITNLTVSLTFLSLVESLGRSSTFVLYAVLSTIGCVILYLKLPETRGVSLEEVEQLFNPTASRSDLRVSYTRIPSPQD